RGASRPAPTRSAAAAGRRDRGRAGAARGRVAAHPRGPDAGVSCGAGGTVVRFARGEPDRAYTERLLDAPSAARGSRDPLARLLAAAAAPPRPHELAGEEAAVEAFRRARHAPARPAASPRRIRPLTAVAIACAGMVVTATAGIALAANGVRL